MGKYQCCHCHWWAQMQFEELKSYGLCPKRGGRTHHKDSCEQFILLGSVKRTKIVPAPQDPPLKQRYTPPLKF